MSFADPNYDDDTALRIRIDTHQQFTQPPIDFADWLVAQIDWSGNETALDVGCGSAMYAKPVSARAARYIAGDLSHGMLTTEALRGHRRVQLDVERLPIHDDSVDVVFANHMLYHVENQPRALAEIWRVLRPGGRFLAATNGRDAMRRVRELPDQALRALGHEPQRSDDPLGVEAFDLESGDAVIREQFPNVRCVAHNAALVFPAAEPVLRYLSSCRNWIEPRLPQGVAWDTMMTSVEEIVAAAIAAEGEFRVSKRAGVFIATKAV